MARGAPSSVFEPPLPRSAVPPHYLFSLFPRLRSSRRRACLLSLSVCLQVVRTLVEFAQGNEGNKLAIATPSLSACINDLFWERCVFVIAVTWCSRTTVRSGDTVFSQKLSWYIECEEIVK